ncbi:menaquinone reductase, iron-sulfur cluster-binding subunit [Desulforhabdus amnigena]|uniref:Menaquinone reductase, iron-sulfur cluster-binding subunit n=2 Tax=Desulforhabdus amnigena TaxID=40218 RepID=A0A9W6FRP6_9BACT|nr:menaquinone reductase iron-sulfur cluster-binding subunit QrcC [Desulforhabdus amnigena]GLI33214.1 menaquinone reductase, iron-sulfur cluster-binding subunit [Desulforhabdus amnigena]
MSEEERKQSAVRFGMVIDLDKCSGCMACSVACQAENNISFRPDETNKLRSITWMEVFYLQNGKDYGEYQYTYLPRPCMHCDAPHHAPCTFVCPVNATTRNEENGIVEHIYPRCIGCRYCIVACPYHARDFNWWDPSWPKSMESMLNPEVSTRMRGVVEKCTFCHHRLLNARAKAYLEETDPDKATYLPACAEACPTKAISFGNLNDPESEVAALIKDPRAFRLLSKLHTEPKVYYLSKHDWVRKQADKGF